MENSCDSFWKWGRARKKMALTKGSCLEGGFCSRSDKANSGADGFPLKIPRKGSSLKIRHCMDIASIPRSHKITEVNPSKFGRACSGLALPIESLNAEVNFCDDTNSEANRINSPTSVVQLNTSDADTMSCNPHDHLRCFSDEKLFPGGNLCEREESSKLRARGMGQKASYDDGIRNRYTRCKGISFLEDPFYCWISEDEDEGMQLRQRSIDEVTRNLDPLGVSEATSNYTYESCKKPKPCHSHISNRGHQIQKKNSEAFAALNILAYVAARVLENGYAGDDKTNFSQGHWKISGPSSEKNVMKRNKGDSNFLPHPAHDHLFTSKMGSPEYGLKRQHDEVIYHGLDDKNGGENMNVRISKRSRSQYLNCKYPDSVLEPLKKCVRR